MYWILQANPKRFDIPRHIENGTPIPGWTANPSARVDSVQVDDRVAIWVSGEAAGVYGIGVINAFPFPGFTDPNEGPGGWLHEEDRGVPKMVLPVSFSWLQKPVFKSELKVDKRFENSLILRMPGGPNPFPLTEREWTCIRKRALTANPEQRDWLEYVN